MFWLWKVLRPQFGLLTFGIFLLFVATWISVWLLGSIQWLDVPPLVLLSTGIWITILAGARRASHSLDGSNLSTFYWGLFFAILGGSWYLTNIGMPLEFMIVFLLALLGAIAIITALR
jgi:hypothetical protein